MGNQFLEIGKQSNNDAVKRRLSLLIADGNTLSAVAYDMKYHQSCLVKNKRCCQKHPTNSITISEDAKLRLIADLEIIEVIKSELSHERDKLIDMNEIHDAYINILHEHCYSVPGKPNFKKYLKKLILDKIQDVHFNLPRCKTKPEQVMSTRASQSAIRNSVDMVDIKNDYSVIIEAAKLLRRQIGSIPLWKFQGKFDDFQIPLLIQAYCKTVIMGTRKIKTDERESNINHSSSLLAQLIIQMSKTDRQTSYTPKNTYIETPLSVGISLDFHTSTRSEEFVNKLKNMGIGISYKKLMSIEKCMAGHVVEETKAHNGVYLPPWTVSGEFTWFAIDNIDLLGNTPSGMNTLHGTAISMYQEKVQDEKPSERLFDRKMKLKESYDDCEMPFLYCDQPKPKKSSRHSHVTLNESKETMAEKRKIDLAWIMATVGCFNADLNVTSDKIKTPGTWTAFNSLSSKCNKKITNIALLAPLIRSPPTDTSTLFTAIMRTGNITTQVMGEGMMTVVTFDMQLYDQAMRLWEVNEEIRSNYIFRPGELHVVFWAFSQVG